MRFVSLRIGRKLSFPKSAVDAYELPALVSSNALQRILFTLTTTTGYMTDPSVAAIIRFH